MEMVEVKQQISPLNRSSPLQVLLDLLRVLSVILFQLGVVLGVALVDVVHVLVIVPEPPPAEMFLLLLPLNQVVHHPLDVLRFVFNVPCQWGVHPGVEKILSHLLLLLLVPFHVGREVLGELLVVASPVVTKCWKYKYSD